MFTCNPAHRNTIWWLSRSFGIICMIGICGFWGIACSVMAVLECIMLLMCYSQQHIISNCTLKSLQNIRWFRAFFHQKLYYMSLWPSYWLQQTSSYGMTYSAGLWAWLVCGQGACEMTVQKWYWVSSFTRDSENSVFNIHYLCVTLWKNLLKMCWKNSLTESQNIQLVSLLSLFDCSALGIPSG